MPTISSATLASTLSSAVRHWQAAEAQLGRAIVLKSGIGVAELSALQQEVAALATAQSDPENRRSAAATTRDTTRTAVRNVNSRFTTTVRGLLPETDFVKMLPTLPTSNAVAEKQLVVARDLENIWARIDVLPADAYPSLTPPLTILVKEDSITHSLTLADYRTRIAAFVAAQDTIRALDETLSVLLFRRDETLKKARTVLNAYRAAIRALFPLDSEQVTTLPKI